MSNLPRPHRDKGSSENIGNSVKALLASTKVGAVICVKNDKGSVDCIPVSPTAAQALDR